MIGLARIFSEWFGVSPASGCMVATLYAANGRVTPHRALATAANFTLSSMNDSLTRLREAMDKGSILNVRGEGYRLSPAGMADCRNAIADANRRGVAA